MSNAELIAAVCLGVGGYLLGALPFAVWMGRLTRGVDLRDHGSGNIGTTNAFRVLGTKAGTIVLVWDIAKGAVPALLAGLFFPPWLAVILVTYHWARTVWVRTAVHLAAEEERRRYIAEQQRKGLLDGLDDDKPKD